MISETRTGGNNPSQIFQYAHENGKRMAEEANEEVQEMIDRSMEIGMRNVLEPSFKSLAIFIYSFEYGLRTYLFKL